MREQNGVQVFDRGEKASGIPKHLESVDLTNIHAPFGIKIVKVMGQEKWQAATEEDLRASEGKRLGIKPSDVNVGPFDCVQGPPGSCFGACSPLIPRGYCHGVNNNGHFYCTCMP